MRAIAEISDKSSQRIFASIFLKRRKDGGEYETDFIDISRHLNGRIGGTIKTSIDSQDYDIGIFREDNVNLSFNNRDGRFNDVEDSRSFWAAHTSRHLSKIKIEYGYLDDNGEMVGEPLVFQGLIDDKSFRLANDDTVSVSVLSRQSVLRNLTVPSGSFNSPIKASLALEILLTRGEILEQFKINPIFLFPDLDITIDEPSKLNGKKLDAAINEILFLTNSVGYIDSDDFFIVKGRRIGSRVTHRFYSNPEYTQKKDNIYEISDFSSGRHRVKNIITFDAAIASSIDYDLDRYGVTKKAVSSDLVSDNTTKQTVCNRVLEEWQYPKDELTIETDYLGSDIEILDLVTIDCQPDYIRRHDAPLPYVNEALTGSAISVGYSNGIHIRPNRGFKVIAIEHNITNAKTKLKLREKGFTNYDGYFNMLTTHKYTIDFVAASSVTISTISKSIDATCAMVQIIDPDDANATIDIKVTRPDASTITFTAGAPITRTFIAFVLEVLET